MLNPPLVLTLAGGEPLVVGSFLAMHPTFTSADYPNGTRVLLAPMTSFEVCESVEMIREMLGVPSVVPVN